MADIEGVPPNMSVSDRDPGTGIDALDRLDNILAALLDVVVRPNRNGFDLLLRTDHVLKRRAKFHGKAAVGDENKADHQGLRRALNAVRAPPKGRSS